MRQFLNRQSRGGAELDKARRRVFHKGMVVTLAATLHRLIVYMAFIILASSVKPVISFRKLR